MPVDPQLRELKERWLASGEFADEQAYLKGLVELGGADLVFLDPDGSTPPWLAVVVRRETNVVGYEIGWLAVVMFDTYERVR